MIKQFLCTTFNYAVARTKLIDKTKLNVMNKICVNYYMKRQIKKLQKKS